MKFVPCYTAPSWRAFADADKAWQAELERVFGRDAGDARYQDRGQYGTAALVSAYTAREVLRLRVDGELVTMSRAAR